MTAPPDGRLRLRGNEPLPIDDPASIWIVESGSVALFGLDAEPERAICARRFLFACEPGEAVFALPAGAAGSIVAVALEQSVLLRADAERLPDAAALATRWVEHWRRFLGDALPPPSAPVGAPAALAEFHRAVLARLRARLREERERKHDLAVERSLRAADASREAVDALSSVLSQSRPGASRGSHPFVALQAVARAQGLTIRPPAAWSESDERDDPLDATCRASGLRLRNVQLRGPWWRQDGGPLVATLREGRAVVALLQPRAGRYELLDPARGSLTPVDATLAAGLEPEARVLYRPLPAGTSRVVDLLRFALRGRGRDVALLVATATAATALGMVAPQATALLVDRAIPDADRALLWQLGAALGCAALGAAIFRLTQSIATLRIETAADAALQAAAWDRLLRLPLAFFRGFSSGDLHARVSAFAQIRSQLGGTTLRTLFGGVIALLNLFLLLYYSPSLTLVALTVAAASAIATALGGARILRVSRKILSASGRLSGLVVQLVHGVAKLRVAAAEERAFARWAREFEHVTRLELARRTIQDRVRVLNLGIAALGTIALFASAAALVGATAGISTGTFLAFHVAYGTFVAAVLALGSTIADTLFVAALHERVRPILEAEPEVHPAAADPGRIAGQVELEHVGFRYGPGGPLVLDDVSLRAEPGQFVALVGPSGSGKSTLLRLVLGLERPSAGAVLIDGQQLGGLDVQAVRRQLGVVLQNGRISAGSIFDNLAAGARVGLGEAWDALRSAGFAEEVAALPMGLHTVVSEGGTNLSGGQRQRLLLARALVHAPRVLLLDEATSALDNRTQAVVAESLARLCITRIVIAHRLSTIASADRIYVIDAGRVVQHGRFDALAAEPGLFARFVARQRA